MRHQLIILTMAATFAVSGTVMAQSATDTATTPTTTTPTTSNAGAYDALPEGNKKIVSAIYEAQFGSPNDTASGTLLTRDDIAAMRQDTGWGNAYRQLQQEGLVTEKNLGQAISNYNHSTRAGGSATVISTAGGEQIIVGKDKSGNAASSTTKAGGNSATAKTDHGKSTVVTTAAGSTAGANAAAAHSSAGGVSHAGGNGNGQGNGGGKVK